MLHDGDSAPACQTHFEVPRTPLTQPIALNGEVTPEATFSETPVAPTKDANEAPSAHLIEPIQKDMVSVAVCLFRAANDPTPNVS
mmetsp:Transcript_65528/g.173607  ORF Transcript_65528/g.173607 Transcript_65528/m.173607 type:complete len:85 (-) Transcript_65528:7-261(-)